MVVVLKKIAANPLYFFEYFKKLYYYLRGTDHIVKRFYRKMKIVSDKETLDMLMKSGRSFVRFGDGEMEILRGGSIYAGGWHQDYDPLLKKKLKALFKKDILLGLTKDQLVSSDIEMKRKGEYFSWLQARYSLYKYAPIGRTYLDAMVFKQNKGLDLRMLFAFLKKKTLVLITSEEAYYKILMKANKKAYFVKTSPDNAWEEYSNILENVDGIIKEKKLSKKNTLFLICLGAAAKPLVLDIDAKGFTAWDMGSFFISYKDELDNY